jgi:hypothetical protein
MSDSTSRLARESEELEKRDRKRAEIAKKAAENLKPCPFCGSDALSVEFDGYISIACGNCGGDWSPCFPGAEIESEKSFAEAVRLWNDRPEPVMRRWEAGSEPPDGLYIEEDTTLIVEVKKYELFWADSDDLGFWSNYHMPLNDFLLKYGCRCIYGPIPIPEPEEE